MTSFFIGTIKSFCYDLYFRSSGFDELDMVGGNLFMVKRCDDEDYVIRHLK